MEGAYLGPRLPAARAPAWRATHHARQGAARIAPESPGSAPARSTMPTASSLRSEQPGLAHLVATFGQGGGSKRWWVRTRAKNDLDQHKNARVSLQRPSWWLSRGPARRRESENAYSLQSSAPCETTWSANNVDLRQIARAPSIVARVNQAAVPREPPRC